MSTGTLIPPEFSLDDKYRREEGTIYLTGVQALVRLPIDHHRADARRGLRTATFICGYRGSPLGVYDMELDRQRRLLRQHDIVHQPGLNEEVGATAVFGSQMANSFPNPKYDGVLGIWYGKGPGVDRTGDAFKHANYAGVGRNGGVLALGGDDPSSKSSTLPSDSEVAFFDALMPTLYPGNVQDILDLGLHGFMLSRSSGLWTAMKIATNVADGAGTAEVAPDRICPIIPTVELDGRPFAPEINMRLIPPVNLEMERTLHYARLELARRYAYENHLNRIVVPARDAWLGILTAGKTYFDVRQALDELGLDDAALERHGVRLLKMGMIFPIEPRIVHEFARGLQEILVIEEKRPFLEMFARDTLYGAPDQPVVLGKSDEQGRPLLPANGELDPELIARAIAARVGRRLSVPSVQARIAELDAVKHREVIPLTLARQAYYCSGCPHNRGTAVPEGTIVAGGIGCHSMALWMDPAMFGNMRGLTQMGGEGAQWVGVAPFTETPHLFQNIGDGTLFHSGILALNFAVAAGVNITYKILYNAAVAMTGGQDAVGTLPVPALTRRLEAEGVKRIVITTDDPHKYRGVALAGIAEVWHRDRLPEAHAALAATPGVTVLIHDQQCAAEKRRLRKRGRLVDPPTRVFINERVCEGCGDCGRASNCLSVEPVETEFGRKTQIHQASCNKDYSCLRGDCPSFLTIEPAGDQPKKQARTFPTIDRDLPEPEPHVPADGFALHMMGIGGTGVVTVNQVLGTAALLDGKQVWGLDQTGLSQKGGPVVSDLRIATREFEGSKVTAGGADLYLGFDLLVAADPTNLAKADAGRTIAVLSTSKVATGKMVTDTGARYPDPQGMLERVAAVSRRKLNIYLDAQRAAEALFGDSMPSNMLLLGAAYQAGALPLAAASIEQAIRLNGAAVEANLLAFRWGRLAVLDRSYVERVVAAAEPPAGAAPSRSHAAGVARPIVEATGATGELRRLLDVRVADLIEYQGPRYARRYAAFVRKVARAEQRATPGRTALAEAVARSLHKLMAYKDEYEVARLHLDEATRVAIAAGFGADVKVTWNLHPPLLRAFGLKRKLKLGPWFTPGMRALRSMKVLRGTPLDPFGYAEVRRIERALIPEYRRLIEAGCRGLTPATHATAVRLAEAPDLIRGYEQIKLNNVARYRSQVRELAAQLGLA
ncbi:MAG: indolepyruvate ferredoxin oxidoreductase family protein [Dehalococcoidia bacterium]